LTGLGLGCFCCLGLGLVAEHGFKRDYTGREGTLRDGKTNLLLPIVCGKEVHFWVSWLKTSRQQASDCLRWIFKLKSNQHMLVSIVVLGRNSCKLLF